MPVSIIDGNGLEAPFQVDLTNCDREPIHIPGSIQPHGLLIALSEPDLTILQISSNAHEFLNGSAAEVVGKPLSSFLSEIDFQNLRDKLEARSDLQEPAQLLEIRCQKGRVNGITHRINGVLILEMEPATTHELEPPIFNNLLFEVKQSIQITQGASTFKEFQDRLTFEVQRLNGFDRVMLYRFDADGNGSVIAEAKRDDLEPFIGLHYPASDIPQQARALYLKNHLRFITDIDYQPAAMVPLLNPNTQAPLDMSHALLRSVSPIHVQYLKNMGVRATMTISIIKENRLWGLIACHHYSPRYVPYEVRTACELFGHFISLELAVREADAQSRYRLKLQTMQTHLLELMSREEDLADALVRFHPNLSDFISATGAAISLNGKYQLVGQTPELAEVKQLIGWLRKNMQGDLFATNALSQHYPKAENLKDKACGLLAISISARPGNYVLWFRPEVIQTVNWAGDPQKPVEITQDTTQLSPRRSFALWKEEVKLKSLPWTPDEEQAAQEIRLSIMRVIYRKSEELARQNAELERRVVERTTQLSATNKELEAFSYSVSHDLRAPLRALDGYSQALMEDAGDKLNERERQYVQYIREGSQRMGTLIEDLISLSRITRDEIHHRNVNLSAMTREIAGELVGQAPERDVELTIQDDLHVVGDTALLRVLLHNLLGNAFKFTRFKHPAQIEFGQTEQNGLSVFYLKDNGAGFKEKYAHKIFGAFQRLHREEEFPGTGIGLATVQRIIHRHGGQIWAEAAVDQGATFYFTLSPSS